MARADDSAPDRLFEAIHRRHLTAQAIGILMERHRLDQAAAQEYLVELSARCDLEVHEVALVLVDLISDAPGRRG